MSDKAVQKAEIGPKEVRWLGKALRSVDFFSELTTSELDKILSSMSLKLYPSDHVLIKQGEKAGSLFVLYTGRVVVSHRRNWRLFEKPLKSLLPGDIFGEIALLDQRLRTATVTTTEPSAVFEIDVFDFRFLMNKNPELARRIRMIADDRKFELDEWEKE